MIFDDLLESLISSNKNPPLGQWRKALGMEKPAPAPVVHKMKIHLPEPLLPPAICEEDELVEVKRPGGQTVLNLKKRS